MTLHASLAHKAALITGGGVGIVIAVDGGAVPTTIAQRRSSCSLRMEQAQAQALRDVFPDMPPPAPSAGFPALAKPERLRGALGEAGCERWANGWPNLAARSSRSCRHIRLADVAVSAFK